MENWTDHGEMSRIVALQVALELEDIESGEWVVVTDSLGSGVIHKGDFNQLSVEVWGSTLQVMNMRNEKPVFSIDSKSSVSLLKKENAIQVVVTKDGKSITHILSKKNKHR